MDSIESFYDLGVVQRGQSGSEIISDCPLCGKERHLYINQETLLWNCKRCAKAGNLQRFIEEVHNIIYLPAITDKLMAELSVDRGLPLLAFQDLKIGWDGSRYVLPYWNDKGIYALRFWSPKTKPCTIKGVGLGLYPKLPQLENEVYICEGEWDTIAWSYLLRKCGIPGTVMGVPGASVFRSTWLEAFRGKDVYLLYDADDAGRSGMARAEGMLKGIAKGVYRIAWPENTNEGHDIRDEVVEGLRTKTLRATCSRILSYIDKTAQPSSTVTPISASEAAALYRKWLFFKDDDAITTMFGAVFANRLDGDPVWMFIIGPPGSAKSELLMSLSKSPNIRAVTTISPAGLISGFRGEGGSDPSLIPQLNGKVLVIKDFTTLLSTHYTARDEVFGILRDAYDGRVEKVLGTVTRTYVSKFGVLAGVTNAIDAYSGVSLGERFLKFRIENGSKGETEGEKILQALTNTNDNKELQMREELAEAGNRTLARSPSVPTTSQEYLRKIVALARFVAQLRGIVERDRYTQYVIYKPSSEVGTRLGKQFLKFGMGVAMYLEHTTLGTDEYRLIKRVAKDTCPDIVQEISKVLWKNGPSYVEEIMRLSNLPSGTINRTLQDMLLLGTVKKAGTDRKVVWTLVDDMLGFIKESEIYD